MELIHTEIDIEAPPDRAWRVLADVARYPEWNPFIRKVEGRLAPGERLRVEMEIPAGTTRVFRPRVTRLAEGEEIRWLGRAFLPGIFDGEHAFVLERFRPDRVRFFQREIFRGALASIARRRQAEIEGAFIKMNEALKARVESPTVFSGRSGG